MSDAKAVVSSSTFPTPSVGTPGATYEELLNQDLTWAMSEGSLFFQGQGRVQQTLQRICRRLDDWQIPYAVAGGMALFVHGFHRFTECVEVLVTRSGFVQLRKALDSRGGFRQFKNSKILREGELGVRIEFLICGEFPGDGKPKPVAFPDPATVAVELGGIEYLRLPVLIELKLAAGMTSPQLSRDFGDVQQLIEVLNLPESLGDKFNPHVRATYRQLWTTMRFSPVQYLSIQQYRRTSTGLSPICQSADKLAAAEVEMHAMLAAGVEIDAQASPDAEVVRLATNDRILTRRFGMKLESDFFEE